MFKCEALEAKPFKVKNKVKTSTLQNYARDQSQYNETKN